jgi:hypothetical protein
MLKEKSLIFYPRVTHPIQAQLGEFEEIRALFERQPDITRHVLEVQGYNLAEAIRQNRPQIWFMFPDQVIVDIAEHPHPAPILVHRGRREQVVGGGIQQLLHPNLLPLLIRRLAALERSGSKAVVVAARLIRYVTADTLVSSLNPGDGAISFEALPVGEVEKQLGLLQESLGILQAAVSLAPYLAVDTAYKKKYSGVVSQLVIRGHEWSGCKTQEIIQIIKQRAARHDLNRGVSVSMPFFDDQTLRIRWHPFTVIPAGRVMFAPAFVVRACRVEQAKITRDTGLSPITCTSLLQQLKMVESAFLANPPAESTH